MKIGKLVLYNVLTYLLLLNTYYLYFGHGLGEFNWSSDYIKSVSLGLIAMTLLLIMNLFVTLSYVSTRALVKKNYLRINFVLIIIVIFVGFIMRIREFMEGKYLIMNWINSFLYVLLLVVIILMLKDLYRLIKRLFEKNKY